DVPGPPREIQEQAMLHAHDLVQTHQSRERARDRHGHDHRAGRLNAAVDRRRLVVAERAQLVAPARVPEIEPDEAAPRAWPRESASGAPPPRAPGPATC